MEQVKIRVPATTANLGPGFDSLGCALTLYNTVTVALTGDELAFEGCETEYASRDNLIVAAYDKTMEYMGLEKEKGLFVKIEADIPISRGLGSSAAMIVAGVMAANELHNGSLSKEEILNICTQIEGHPDNVAPAVYGGLTASMAEKGNIFTSKYNISPNILFTALIPNFPLSTQKARSVLPKEISFKDGVYNISHTAVLLKALENGDEKTICAALKDKLHQPFRTQLIEGWNKAYTCIKNTGNSAICISGAGPTLLTIAFEQSTVDSIKKSIEKLLPHWRILPLNVDFEGAKIL